MNVSAKAFKDKLGRQVLQDIKFMLTHSECVIEMWKTKSSRRPSHNNTSHSESGNNISQWYGYG